jgi:hypothetical protein
MNAITRMRGRGLGTRIENRESRIVNRGREARSSSSVVLVLVLDLLFSRTRTTDEYEDEDESRGTSRDHLSRRRGPSHILK